MISISCFKHSHITVLIFDVGPIARFVIEGPLRSFPSCPPSQYFFSLYSSRMSSQIPKCTFASLQISQFLNSHRTQLRFMYSCDPTSDPRMVILPQTRIEYGLWLNSENTRGEPVFYCSLYMLRCWMWGRETEMYCISSQPPLYRP